MRSTIVFLLLCKCSALFAQNGYSVSGAGESGMANATTAVYSQNVMFHNIAALAKSSHSHISFGYDYRNFVSGLNNIYLQYVHTLPSFNLGISTFKTGDDVLNELTGSVGVAQQLGIASIGIKINYHQLYSAPYGYTRNFSLSAGVLAALSEKVKFGAYLGNVGQLKFRDELQEYPIPVVLNFGLSYKATENLLLALSASKDLDHELQLSSGISYNLIKTLFLRTGVNWYHKNFYYGMGYQVNKLMIDYALNPVSNLGQVHSLTVSYQLRELNEDL